MKQKIALLAAGIVMTVGSFGTLGVLHASPAAAEEPADTIVAHVGYVINCFQQPLISLPFTLPTCLGQAVKSLLVSLNILPQFPNNSLNAPAPVVPSSPSSSTEPKQLDLPSNVAPLLKSLPTALQTPPLANASEIIAPIKRLVPSASSLKASSLPKPSLKPRPVPVELVNIADSSPDTSSSPVSAADAAAVAGIGAIALFASRNRVRRFIAAR